MNIQLPQEFKPKLIEVLAELQDNECYANHQSPKWAMPTCCDLCCSKRVGSECCG